MDDYSLVGGTTLTGPVGDWQHPDGYWTEEFGAELAAAQAERRAVVCPVCGQPNGSVRTDAVAGTRPDVSGVFQEFAGYVGSVTTLEGCGHTITR